MYLQGILGKPHWKLIPGLIVLALLIVLDRFSLRMHAVFFEFISLSLSLFIALSESSELF